MILVAIGVVLAVFVAALGWSAKEARKPLHKRGVMVNGAAALAKGARLVWRKPGLVLDRVAALYLVGLVVVVAVALVAAPNNWPKVVVPAISGLCVGAVVWDWRLTRGRPWSEVLHDVFTGDAAQRAVTTVHPDAKPGTVKIRDGRVEVAVEHVGPVDVERVGQVLHAPHVELVPGAEMGRARVVVYDRAPAPELDPWQALSVVHRWPGPSSTDPDAPIPVAYAPDGRLVHIAVPGDGGKHLLVAGSTGAGKSGTLSVVLAEVAYRDVEMRLCDPKMVEFQPWEPRGFVARGVDATGEMLDRTYDDMMARYDELQRSGARKWTGRKILLVIDELAAVTTGPTKNTAPRVQKLGLILAMGRAAGVGLVVCTQRPSHNVIPLDLRDNTRVRIGLGCESPEQTEMILGGRQWPCHEIPESLPGVAYVRVDRHATLCRSFFLGDVDVERVAAATSHLKGV